MSNRPEKQTHFYKITNAKKLPKTDSLLLSGGEYFGRVDKSVAHGIVCRRFTAQAEVIPLPSIQPHLVEELGKLPLVTPEQAIAARGITIRDLPIESEEEVEMHDTLYSDDEHIDYILTGLEAGEVGSLISPGGTGKSMLGLTMGIQMAMGQASYLSDKKTKRRVCYLSLEDKIKGVRNRIRRISRTLELSDQDKKQVTANFRVVTKRLILASNKEEMNADPILNLFVGKPTPDLLIVDTARRLNHLNENDSSEMSAFISILEEVGEELGCVVLLLHHTSKASTGAKARGEEVGSEAARGSGAIVDNGRGTWYLSKLSKKEAEDVGISPEERHSYVTLDHTKCNAESSQERKILKKGDYGILQMVDLTGVTKDGGEEDHEKDSLF